MDNTGTTEASLAAQLAAAQQELAALKTAYRRLQRTLDRVPDGVTVQDGSGALVYANDAAARLCGFPSAAALLQASPETIRGRFELHDAMGQPIAPDHLPGRRVLLGEGDPPPTTVGFRSIATGRQQWATIRAMPLLNESGQVDGVINAWHDVTELKQLYAAAQAEIAQRAQTEQHLRLITDALPVLVAYIDASQRYQFVNQAYEAWFESSRDVIIGQHLWEMVGEAAYATIRHFVERALAGETLTYERMITLKTGVMRTVQATYVPDRDERGAVQGFISLITDITQRKKDEDALRMHAHILDSMSEGVSVSNEDGIIIYTNPAEDALFGYPRGALLGQHVSVQNSYSPDENQQVVSEVIDRLKREGLWIGEFANVRQDGTSFFTSARISRLIMGERQYWVCVQHDSTVEKARAVERAQLLIREQQARREAEAANRLKDDFLAVLSHELRTPMTAILGYGQLLQRRPHDADYTARTITKMMQSAAAQMQLIEDLLDMSRIITGKLSLHIAPLDLASVIGAAIDAVRPALDAKGLALHTSLDSAARKMNGDAARLQQVVWNLLANAVKFTPAQGQITVHLKALPDTIRLEVTDTGQGIHADLLPYVFDRFRQGEHAMTRSVGGLGLGLSIVRHLVELHGGTVHATSAGEGHGATMTVMLPRTGLSDTTAAQ